MSPEALAEAIVSGELVSIKSGSTYRLGPRGHVVTDGNGDRWCWRLIVDRHNSLWECRLYPAKCPTWWELMFWTGGRPEWADSAIARMQRGADDAARTTGARRTR